MINNKLYTNSSLIQIGNKQIYTGVSFNLLSSDLIKKLNDKIFLFRNKLSINANYADIIGILVDYKLINTKINCGGYCSIDSKEIAYTSGGLKLLFHEIGHAIQAELGINKTKLILSELILEEQQAETISYYLYNSLLQNYLPPKKFNSYFCLDHINFLDNWYKNYNSKLYTNDLFDSNLKIN